MKSNENIKAVNQMAAMFQQQAEDRISRHNRDVGETWKKIAEQTGIDIHNVIWVPHPTEPNTIIPVQMKLPEHG